MQKVISLIRRLAESSQLQSSSDDELLDRFFDGHDEQAFADIVDRHGPMVFGVCQRILNHRQSAEDAFQATFLTLVRKGHTIRQRKSLSFWLYRVAYRLSLSQRSRIGRHPEQALTDEIAVTEPYDAAWNELRTAVDAELQRLPPRYRAVMILCLLEGKTYEDAARELGCPKGTVAIRLLRGREMLKRRLTRRGLLAAAGGLATQAALPHALGTVPAALAGATVLAAVAVAQGVAIASVVSLAVAALVRAAGRDLWQEKCKNLVMAIAALGVIGSGFSVSAQTRIFRSKPPRARAIGTTESVSRSNNNDVPRGGMTLDDKETGGKLWHQPLSPATNAPVQRQQKP